MPTFKDNKGRSWSLDLTVAAAKRVRTLTGHDLFRVYTSAGFETLFSDPITLIDVIYAIVKPQADEAKVDDVAFGESLAGDAVDEATRAMLDALVSFCPSPTSRETLRRVLDRTNVAIDAQMQAMDRALTDEAIDRSIQQVLNPAPRQTLRDPPPNSGERCTDAPASPGSIPDPSPSPS